MSARRLLLPALAIFLVAGLVPPAAAFRACTPAVPAPTGHWPDPRNTALFGTQKWEFDWRVARDRARQFAVPACALPQSNAELPRS